MKLEKKAKIRKEKKNGEEKQCQGKIPTSNIALKWRHKTNEMATDDIKMGLKLQQRQRQVQKQ